MLEWLLLRAIDARHVDQFVVATTKLPEDDPIDKLADRLNIPCFRGSENDCLDRCYQAVKPYAPETIVRLTGDNPIVDGQFIDWVLGQFQTADPACDYVNTHRSKTYPQGLSVEVLPFHILESVWKADMSTSWREHVTPYIFHHPERFSVFDLTSEENFGQFRWTVDTLEDLKLMRCVFEHFLDTPFSWREVIQAQSIRPEWQAINESIQQQFYEVPSI